MALRQPPNECIHQIACGTSFKADPLDRVHEIGEALSNILSHERQFPLEQLRSLTIDNAQRTGSQRYV